MILEPTFKVETRFGNGVTVSSGSVNINYGVPKDRECEIETPIKLLGGSKLDVHSIGAFSFVNLDNYICNVKRIGRFTLFGPQTFVGGGAHTVESLSPHMMFRGRQDWWYKDFTTFYKDNEALEALLERQNKREFSRKTGIVIGNDVWIGARAIIMLGVTIGDGAIVGAGTVVTKDVPPYSIVVGSPARVLRKRFKDRTIEKLLKIKWWDYGPDILKGLDLSQPDIMIDSLEERIYSGEYEKYVPEKFIFKDKLVYKEEMNGDRRIEIKLP